MKPVRLNIYVEFLIVVGLIAVFGVNTYLRNFIWQDDLTLWQDVVEKSPNKARAYNAIGMYYYKRQKPDKAIPFFQQSLFLRPEYGIGHNNLGLCFLARGQIDQAIEEFKLAIKTKPLNGMWHVNLGIAYWKKGLHELANKEIGLGKALRRRHKTRIVKHSEGYRQ